MRRSGQAGLKAYRYDGSFGEAADTNRVAVSILFGILLLISLIIAVVACPACVRECDFCTCKRTMSQAESLEKQMERYREKKAVLLAYERRMNKGKRGGASLGGGAHDDYSNRFRPIRAQGHRRANANQVVPLVDNHQ